LLGVHITVGRRIIVFGAQNSGTRWICNLISNHPDSGKNVDHASIPQGDGAPAFLDDPNSVWDTYLIVVRDANCVRASLKAKNPPNWKKYIESGTKVYDTDIVKNFQLAIQDLIENKLIPLNINYVFVSYETMMQFKESYLTQILTQIDLDPKKYPWDLEGRTPFTGLDPSNGKDKYFADREYCEQIPIDGNRKYIRKEYIEDTD